MFEQYYIAINDNEKNGLNDRFIEYLNKERHDARYYKDFQDVTVKDSNNEDVPIFKYFGVNYSEETPCPDSKILDVFWVLEDYHMYANMKEKEKELLERLYNDYEEHILKMEEDPNYSNRYTLKHLSREYEKKIWKEFSEKYMND